MKKVLNISLLIFLSLAFALNVSFSDTYRATVEQKLTSLSCCKKEKGTCGDSDSSPCCDCCQVTGSLLITYAIAPTSPLLIKPQIISSDVTLNTTYLNHYHFDYSSNLFHPPKVS